MSFHKNYTLDDVHAIVARIYADIAARDADTDFSGDSENANKAVCVSSPLSIWVLLGPLSPTTWLELTSEGRDEFIELIDTPAGYSSQGGLLVAVNSGEDALEFTDTLGLLNVDNLRLDGNTLSSTDTNGNITLDPNGTGVIDASTSQIRNVVDPTADQDVATKKYIDDTTIPANTFLGLTDVPASFTSAGRRVVQVNNAETALEFPYPFSIKEEVGGGIPFEIRQSDDAKLIFFTVQHNGHFGIAMNVNGSGQHEQSTIGISKLLAQGIGVTRGSMSMNAGQSNTAGQPAVFDIGLSVWSSDQSVRVGNPNNAEGLKEGGGNIIADVDGDLVTDLLRARTAAGLSLLDSGETKGLTIIDGNLAVTGADAYLNFGGAGLASGYGIRDNAGNMECKDSVDSAWRLLSPWRNTGNDIYHSAGKVGVKIAAPLVDLHVFGHTIIGENFVTTSGADNNNRLTQIIFNIDSDTAITARSPMGVFSQTLPQGLTAFASGGIVTALYGTVDCTDGTAINGEIMGVRGRARIATTAATIDDMKAVHAHLSIAHTLAGTHAAGVDTVLQVGGAGVINTTNVYLFRGRTTISGGTINSTNIYGLHLPDLTGLGATNAWGVGQPNGPILVE